MRWIAGACVVILWIWYRHWYRPPCYTLPLTMERRQMWVRNGDL